MTDTTIRRAAPILFFKAVTKKQVWIPGYTKRNGQVVLGHYAMVNVSTDHDEHKAVSGNGTFSEKEAHKKLSKKDWFHGLPHDHKVAVVLNEATKIQQAASVAAQTSVFKKKILAGQKPSAAEWAAFNGMPDGKKQDFVAAFASAGKEAAFAEGFGTYLKDNPPKPAEAAAPVHAGSFEPEVPKAAVEPAKPAVGVSMAPEKDFEAAPTSEIGDFGQAEPTPKPAVGPNAKLATVLAKIDAAKLDPSNTNAKAVNSKLAAVQAAIEKGDAKSLLMQSYGSNSYGVKIAKLANEALAAMGSEHQVKAGQKMAEHPALKQESASEPAVEVVPAAAQEPAQAAAAEPLAPWPTSVPEGGGMPVAVSAKDLPDVGYAPELKLANKINKIKAFAIKGDAEGLHDYYNKLLDPKAKAYAEKVIDFMAAKEGASSAQVASQAAAAPEPASAYDKASQDFHAELGALAEKAGYSVKVTPNGILLGNKGPYAATFANMTQAENAVTKLAKVGINAHVIGTHPFLVKISGKLPPMEHAAAAKPAANADADAIDASLKNDADEALAAGDMQTLKDIVQYATKEGMDATAQYVAKHIGDLATKQAEAAKPSADGKPAKPHVDSLTSKGIADKIEEHLNEGNLPLLQAQQTMIGKGHAEGTNFAKLEQYVKDAIAHVEAKSPHADGPQEGETKQGAYGTLVFKDGRWHKQGGDEKPAATGPSISDIIAANPFPKLKGTNSKKLKAHAEKMMAIAQEGGAEALAKFAKVTNGGHVASLGFKTINPEGSKYGEAATQFAQWAKKFITDVQESGAAGTGDKPAPAATKPAQKVVGSVAHGEGAQEITGWKQIGPQGGYNPGGTFKDTDGQDWYVKFPAGGEKIAKNELLAVKLYELAGVDVPEVKLIKQNGKIGLASKIVDGAKTDKAALLAGKAPGLLSGFGVDAWLANWDTVGNNPSKGFDNILIKPDGSAVRIDAGGALLYGGAGGKKQKFENEVTDLKTMLDPAKNANTAAVFGKMSQADITASVAKVAAIPDHEIEGLVMEFGPGDSAEKKRLADKLIARKADMIQQFPGATKNVGKEKPGKPEKAKPDPTSLPVDADVLPKPHDFMNWGGTGKPISEKPYVKGNIADEQEILNLALQGNLTALKAYRFQPVDKMTGAPTGEKLSIEKHPSKYVQDYYNTTVSYLDMLANPPEELRHYEGKKASTLASLSALFKPHDFGMTTEKAPKNQQVGFWIALGVADEPGKFAKVAKKLSVAAISKAKEMHAKLPQSVRTFISGVQGSGSYNNPYRDGKDVDHGGNKTRAVLTDLYNNATAHDAGTTIHKWMSMAPEMVKQFMDAPEGLVFQNPGSMCTSYDADATKHFGKDRVTIRYADGAKALDSFASGSFKSEMEITTLPGARFMVLSRKMVADVEHGKPNEKRFELELLMLPPDPTYVDNLLKV